MTEQSEIERVLAVARVREADLDADPPWLVFEALPGVPSPRPGTRR